LSDFPVRRGAAAPSAGITDYAVCPHLQADDSDMDTGDEDGNVPVRSPPTPAPAAIQEEILPTWELPLQWGLLWYEWESLFFIPAAFFLSEPESNRSSD